MGPGDPEGQHHSLGARVDEADPVGAWDVLDDHLGKLDGGPGDVGEGVAQLGLPLHGLDHGRVAVAQEQRAVAEHHVEEPASVGGVEIRTVAVGEEELGSRVRVVDNGRVGPARKVARGLVRLGGGFHSPQSPFSPPSARAQGS